MAYKNGIGEVIAYKLRHVGARELANIAWLNLVEAVLMRISRTFPTVSFSPRSIQIETTTNCNLKCTHCELSYWTEPAADLRLPDFERILDHLPKLRRVELTGIGEPIMNRDFYKIVALLKSRGVRISMTDNFTMMTEKAARRIIELDVDRIAISLDGASKQTYEKVRVGANFDTVTRNARRLVRLREEMGRLKPELLANFVVTANSYWEAPAIIELAHDIGIGLVQFDCVKTFEQTEGLHAEVFNEKFNESLDKAFARARELGVVVKWTFFEKDEPIEHCSSPWNRAFVTRDGYVHPCCLTTQTGDRQAQNRRSLGNLIESPIEEIWHGAGFGTMRRNMKNGILPNACRLCPSYTGRPDPVGKAQEDAWRASPVAVPVVVVPRKRSEAKAPAASG